jgi:ELWxxDGT repeat protein
MRRLVAICAAAALAALVASTSADAAAYPLLLKDINPTGSSNPSQMTAVGSTLFFAANDGVHGNELWKSDGTAAGTKMVKNIRPLGKSSDPQNLVNVNGTLFFTANDGAHGRELWRSNGTAAGTKLVKDLIPQCSGGFGCIGGLLIEIPPVAIGSRLFFINDYCCYGTSTIYVSDGTAAGTKQLKTNLPVSTTVGAATGYNGKFYFAAYTTYGEYASVWVSNGTRAGTYDLGAASGDDIAFLPVSGQSLYFATYYEDETEIDVQLWKTDGTAAGTKPLTSVNALAEMPIEAALMNSRLYFNDGPLGSLWKTDGTAKGTKSISAGRAEWLTVASGKLYFTRGGHLWMSNGTPTGTADVEGFGGLYARQLMAVGAEICFGVPDWDAATWTLWESDGTDSGTYAVRSFVNPIDDGWGPLGAKLGATLGATLVFGADDGTHGTELWSYAP